MHHGLRRSGLIHDFMEGILFPALNLKMFCYSCRQNCLFEAKYCHKCKDLLKQSMTEGASCADEGSKKDESGSKPGATGSGIEASGLLTFTQFRARKEEDRSKHFRNKPGKKQKLDPKGKVDCQAKINIGVMIMKDGRLSIKSGYSLPINVTLNITSEDLLEKAVEKHSRFHKDVVQSNKKAFYQLLYADKNKVSTLPGSNEPFTLKGGFPLSCKNLCAFYVRKKHARKQFPLLHKIILLCCLFYVRLRAFLPYKCFGPWVENKKSGNLLCTARKNGGSSEQAFAPSFLPSPEAKEKAKIRKKVLDKGYISKPFSPWRIPHVILQVF